MTDPIGTAQERKLIERARLEAKRESEVSRMMAQSKSLRQAGHEPPRDDLYMWSKPEETNTWKLADALQSRIAEVGRLELALQACRDRFVEYVELHKAKLPPPEEPAPANWRDIAEKIERNQAMVDLCDAALSLQRRV